MGKSSFLGGSWKDYLLKFWAGYNKVNEVLGSLIVAAISVIVFMGICARYALRTPFEWTDEFAIYGFI